VGHDGWGLCWRTMLLAALFSSNMAGEWGFVILLGFKGIGLQLLVAQRTGLSACRSRISGDGGGSNADSGRRIVKLWASVDVTLPEDVLVAQHWGDRWMRHVLQCKMCQQLGSHRATGTSRALPKRATGSATPLLLSSRHRAWSC